MRSPQGPWQSSGILVGSAQGWVHARERPRKALSAYLWVTVRLCAPLTETARLTGSRHLKEISVHSLTDP